MFTFKENLKALMRQKGIKQSDLARTLKVVPSVVSKMCSEGTSLSFENAKKLNRYFKTAIFQPFKIVDGKMAPNYYGMSKTKANEVSAGQHIINLYTKNVEKIFTVKYHKPTRKWIYKTDESPSAWLSEYNIDKAPNVPAASEQAKKDLEVEEGKKAFLKLIEKQMQEKQEPKPETATEDSIPPIEENNKDILKKIVLSIVEQLLECM